MTNPHGLGLRQKTLGDNKVTRRLEAQFWSEQPCYLFWVTQDSWWLRRLHRPSTQVLRYPRILKRVC